MSIKIEGLLNDIIYHTPEDKLVKERFKIMEWNRVLEHRS